MNLPEQLVIIRILLKLAEGMRDTPDLVEAVVAAGIENALLDAIWEAFNEEILIESDYVEIERLLG